MVNNVVFAFIFGPILRFCSPLKDDLSERVPLLRCFQRNALVSIFFNVLYFCRFGSKDRPNGDSLFCEVPYETQYMTIGKCLRERHEACLKPKFQWHQYICGDQPECFGNRLSGAQAMRRAIDATKSAILNRWFVVGIADPEFMAHSFSVLEEIFPRIFKNAGTIVKYGGHSDLIEKTQASNRSELREDEYNYLAKGTLRYEMDMYEFIKSVLARKHQALNVAEHAQIRESAFLTSKESIPIMASVGVRGAQMDLFQQQVDTQVTNMNAGGMEARMKALSLLTDAKDIERELKKLESEQAIEQEKMTKLAVIADMEAKRDQDLKDKQRAEDEKRAEEKRKRAEQDQVLYEENQRKIREQQEAKLEEEKKRTEELRIKREQEMEIRNRERAQNEAKIREEMAAMDGVFKK